MSGIDYNKRNFLVSFVILIVTVLAVFPDIRNNLKPKSEPTPPEKEEPDRVTWNGNAANLKTVNCEIDYDPDVNAYKLIGSRLKTAARVTLNKKLVPYYEFNAKVRCQNSVEFIELVGLGDEFHLMVTCDGTLFAIARKGVPTYNFYPTYTRVTRDYMDLKITQKDALVQAFVEGTKVEEFVLEEVPQPGYVALFYKYEDQGTMYFQDFKVNMFSSIED